MEGCDTGPSSERGADDGWSWPRIKQYASRLGLKPWEFWELTPRELVEWAEGFRWRVRKQQEIALQAAIVIVAPWTKDIPTVQQLLGETSEAEADRLISGSLMSEADLQALYEKQKANRK